MEEEVAGEGEGQLVRDAHKLAALLRPLTNERRLELLVYLRQPHYLEEIANHLRVSRQAATIHVKELQSIGLLTRRTAERPGKNVVEYGIDTPALFDVYEYFERLAVQMMPVGAGSFVTKVASSPARRPTTSPVGVAGLVVVHGLELGRQYPLNRAGGELSWMIGRKPSCHVRLDHDTFASGRHAEVRLGKVGSDYSIVDAFSRNGTLLNWDLIPRGEPVRLRHGDVIGVGRTLLLFRQGQT